MPEVPSDWKSILVYYHTEYSPLLRLLINIIFKTKSKVNSLPIYKIMVGNVLMIIIKQRYRDKMQFHFVKAF